MMRLYWFPINNLKKLTGWKLIVLVLVTSSCVLDSDNENFVEVDPTPNLEFSSELTYNFDGRSNYPILDTILMLELSSIEFAFRFGTTYGYEVYANKTLISNGQDNRFSLSAIDFERGYQEVVIVQYAKSGTNSLSDQLNLEYVAYADTFGLTLLEAPPETLIINSASLEDGKLIVSWKAYNGLGFQGYQIERNYSNSSRIYESTINNKEVAEWSDPLYIGIDATYTLKVDIGGYFFESGSFTYESEYDPAFKIKGYAGSQFLTWNKPPFSTNISSYTLYKGSDIISEAISGTDTSSLLDFNPKFGEIPPTYALHVYSHFNNEDEQIINRGLRDQVGVGIAVPPHNSMIYNGSKAKYYCVFSQVYHNTHYQGGFYEMNENLEVSNYFEIPGSIYNAYEDHKFVISPDGESLYHYEFVTVTKIDMNTLEEGESIHTDKSNNFRHEWKYSASNNGLVTSYEDNYDYSFRVHDFTTGNIIFDSARYGGSSHLSFDGDLLLLANSLYSYGNGSFEFVRTLDFDNVRYSRFINDSNDILIVTNTNIHIYSLQHNSTLKSIPVTIPEDSGFLETKFYFEPSNMQLVLRKSTGGWKFVYLENEVIFDEDIIGTDYAGDYVFISRPTHSYPGYAKKIND